MLHLVDQRNMIVLFSLEFFAFALKKNCGSNLRDHSLHGLLMRTKLNRLNDIRENIRFEELITSLLHSDTEIIGESPVAANNFACSCKEKSFQVTYTVRDYRYFYLLQLAVSAENSNVRPYASRCMQFTCTLQALASSFELTSQIYCNALQRQMSQRS